LVSGKAVAVLLVVIIALSFAGLYFYSKASNNPNNSDTPDPSIREAFINYMVSNNVSQADAGNFYGNNTLPVNNANDHYDGFVPQVHLFGEDATTFAELYRNNSNQTELSAASTRFNELDMCGNVSVINPGLGTYRTTNMTDSSIKMLQEAINYETRTGATPLTRDECFGLCNDTINKPALADFSKR
jgi:hypothetical protein